MGDNQLPKKVQDLIDQISKENGFSDYKIELKSGSNAGDGFASALIAAKIVDGTSEKCLDLVIKLAPLSETHRKEFFTDKMFEHETTFYNEVEPAFKKFQEEKNVPKEDRFYKYPKCYYAVADEKTQDYIVVLEDLRPQGYKQWDKTKVTTIENARLAMRELGKFHGISVAMKDQKPEEFAKFKKITDIYKFAFTSETLRGMLLNAFDRSIEAMKLESHKVILREIKENFNEHFAQILDESNPFAVIIHGDFYNNNYLFKFDEEGVAEDFRILDWQIIRYVSPAVDLLYNIFSSTAKEFRDKEFDNLIELYYQTLSKTVKLLGSDPEKLFSFNDLKNELKRCGNYALIMPPQVIQYALADESSLNLEHVFDKVDGHSDLITGLKESAQKNYEERVNGIVEDIVRLGYTRKVNEY